MDNIKIQTTQNVEIEYELASIGDRILATLLDLVFIIAYSFIVLFVVSLLASASKSETVIGAISTLLFLPIMLYNVLCETFFQGKSFGKMILKIKVVKLDGTQANFGAYVLRWLLRIIDIILFQGAVAILAIFANGKGQRIGDMAAGTTVIKMKQSASLNDTILVRPKPNYNLVFPEVSKLSDTDVAIIKEVIQVSMRTNNYTAIEKLTNTTKATMGITTSLPNAQFLSTVIQDYNHYSFDK